HSQLAQTSPAPLPQQCENTSDQPPEPGKTRAIQQHSGRVLHQQLWSLKHMPQLGAHDTEYGGNCDNPNRVCVNLPAPKVAMKNPAGAHGSQPKHNTEGAD